MINISFCFIYLLVDAFLVTYVLIEFPTLPKTSESQTGIIVSQITEALDKEEYFKAFWRYPAIIYMVV